jgi:hypothetical protein
MANESIKNSRPNEAIMYYEEASNILPESTRPYNLKGML